MWDNLTINEVVEYAKDPYPSIRKWIKDKGKKVVGSTFADVPEEVIHASVSYTHLTLPTIYSV